jgi:hypothetical protein
MVCVWSTHAEIYFLSLLAWYEFLPTHDEMDFVFSLAWVEIGQLILRYILCTCWHGMSFVNASGDTFCVAAGMGGV